MGDNVRFKQNVAAVFAANVAAQVVPLLALPLLARIYTPGEYAALATFISVVVCLNAVSVLKVDWYIASQVRSSYAYSLGALGIGLLALAVLVSVPIFASGAFSKIPYVTWGAAEDHLWMAPVAMVGFGLFNLASAALIRTASLAPLAKARVAQATATVGISAAYGLIADGGGYGLIVGYVAAPWLALLQLIYFSDRSLLSFPLKLRLSRSIVVGKRFGGRILTSGAGSVVNTLSLTLPLLFIGFLYTPVELGCFAMAQRLTSAPLGAITGAISQSYWAEATGLYRSDAQRLWGLSKALLIKLTIIGAAAGLALIASPLYISLLLGNGEWTGVSATLARLAPLAVTQVIGSSLAPILTISLQVRWLFLWDSIRLLAVLGGFFIMVNFGLSFQNAVLLYSLVMAASYVVLLIKNIAVIRAAV